MGNAFFSGSFFAVIWSLIMWFFVWPAPRMSAIAAVEAALLAGVLFGVAMASYYAYGRYRYKLPSWRELGTSPSGT